MLLRHVILGVVTVIESRHFAQRTGQYIHRSESTTGDRLLVATFFLQVASTDTF